MDLSYIPLYAVLVSLLAVPLIIFSSARPNLREFWTILAAVTTFVLGLPLGPVALRGDSVALPLPEVSPAIPLLLKADPLGIFFATIASGLWIFTSFYSVGYMRGAGEVKQTRYFASFAICLSATIGIAFSGNLLTFVIFYEILTLATYPLVIHKEYQEAISAGRKYHDYTLTAGLLLIAATAMTYYLTGATDCSPGGLCSGLDISPGEIGRAHV